MTHPRPTPVERFLGAVAPGPFGLLCLRPENCIDEQIIAALDRQLARVDNHPEGDTPEADEVRLALHAAAAQLLDRAVRAQIIARWSEAQRVGNGGGSGQGAGGAPRTSVPMPALPPPVLSGGPGIRRPGPTRTGLEHDAILTLAQYGGWNEQALRRLAVIAAARGLPPTAVADTLRNLGRHSHRDPAAPPRQPSRPAQPQPVIAPPPPAPVPLSRAQAAVQSAATGAATTSRAQPPASPEAEHPDSQTTRRIDPAVIFALIVIASIMVIALGGVLILTRGDNRVPQQATQPATAAPAGPPAPATQPPTTVATTAPPGDPPTADHSSTQPAPARRLPRFADAAEALRALRASVDTVREEPEKSADRFSEAVEWLSGWWCRLDTGQRRAAVDACVEFIYASSRWPDVVNQALDAIAAGSEPLADRTESGGLHAMEIWPAAWSAGLLTRLTRERDLPAALAARIDHSLSAIIGADRPRQDTSFEAGAAAALGRMPLKILQGSTRAGPFPGPPLPARGGDTIEHALRRWSEAIAATTTDPMAQERLLVDALERIMLSAPEPDADRRVFEAIQTLAVELRWRRGGPGRARLVDWFRDQRISSGDLNVLTSAIATASAAEGITPVMVLAWSAGPTERENLRIKYAAAWAIAEAAAGDQTASRFARAAKDAISGHAPTPHPVDDLAAAVQFALLNHAARRLWRGERSEAENLIDEARLTRTDGRVRGRASSRPGTLLRPPDVTDGQWGLTFLAAGQNRPVRLERLTELERTTLTGSALGPVDAEVLVEAACFATPQDVRVAAQRVASRLGSQATVVNAMLEMVPKAPKIESVSTMVEALTGSSLPPVSHPEWMHAARRALVERLTELLAAGGESGSIDRLAAVLRQAYPPSAYFGGSSADEGTPPEVLDLAELSRLWRAEAENFVPNSAAHAPLDRILSRRAGRMTLAQGPVQTWAAEQAALAELLAYIVTGEQSGRGPQVRAIMDDLAAQRRSASHIFTQIMATERAMLRLWLLRYGHSQEISTTWPGN